MAGQNTSADEAKQAQEQADRRREAVKKLREDKSFSEVTGRYNQKYFWMRWKKVEGFDAEDPADKVDDGFSSVAPKFANIDYGVYERQGKDGKVRIRFDFDPKNNHEIIKPELTDRVRGDNKERKPTTKMGWNALARERAIEAVKFAAETGRTEITPQFPDRCDFISELGNIGPNTLQYHRERMDAAIAQANKMGVAINPNSAGFKAFMTALEKYSRNDAEAMKVAIAQTQDNGKKAEKLKEITNPGSMREQLKAFAEAGKVTQAERDAFSKEVDNAVNAQIKKVDELQKKFDDATDPTIKAELKAQLEEATDRRGELLACQQGLKDDANDPAKVSDKEALAQSRVTLNELINPEQKYTDALKELKDALAGVKDRSDYTDPDKEKLDKFQAKIDELEKKLAKAPLTDAEQKSIHDELKKVTADMNKLAKDKPDFKQKMESVIEKAEKYADGKKPEMDALANIDAQLAVLEKAAKGFNDFNERHANYDPQELVGLIVGKQIPLPGIRDQYVRLENPGQVQSYVEKQFNSGAHAKQRQDFQGAMEAEKTRLEAIINRAKGDSAKVQELKGRLDKVNVAPTPGAKLAP